MHMVMQACPRWHNSLRMSSKFSGRDVRTVFPPEREQSIASPEAVWLRVTFVSLGKAFLGAENARRVDHHLLDSQRSAFGIWDETEESSCPVSAAFVGPQSWVDS